MCSATTGCAPRAWRVQAWACPLFLLPGAAVVSGVKGQPAGLSRARRAHCDAKAPLAPEGGPVTCAAHQKVSGGEAASF